MELRHLRYFLAIADEGSFSLAAERRLHTAQPSLSRQIRDLEAEVGAQLFERTPKGAELTAAGRAFLDHARAALLQAEAAVAAARKAVVGERPRFALGFLTGHEIKWLAAALQELKQIMPDIDVVVSSQSSPELAAAVARGRLDAAFMRAEKAHGLSYRIVSREPLIAVIPAGHELAGRAALTAADLAAADFIMPTRGAPVLREVIDAYAQTADVELSDEIQAENVSMALSLVVSTGGVTILPDYVRPLAPAAVLLRPLAEPAPTIDLVIGYDPSSQSTLLKRFLRTLPDLGQPCEPA